MIGGAPPVSRAVVVRASSRSVRCRCRRSSWASPSPPPLSGGGRGSPPSLGPAGVVSRGFFSSSVAVIPAGVGGVIGTGERLAAPVLALVGA